MGIDLEGDAFLPLLHRPACADHGVAAEQKLRLQRLRLRILRHAEVSGNRHAAGAGDLQVITLHGGISAVDLLHLQDLERDLRQFLLLCGPEGVEILRNFPAPDLPDRRARAAVEAELVPAAHQRLAVRIERIDLDPDETGPVYRGLDDQRRIRRGFAALLPAVIPGARPYELFAGERFAVLEKPEREGHLLPQSIFERRLVGSAGERKLPGPERRGSQSEEQENEAETRFHSAASAVRVNFSPEGLPL